MQAERRKSDLAILERLGDIQTNLALNTQETTRLANEQNKLNGKVVAHESRLQSIEAANAMTSVTLAQLHTNAMEKSQGKKDWTDWALKAGIVLVATLFYFLLTKAGFPNFLH